MKRPEDMIYWYNERPPFFKLLFLGFQQVVVISISLVMINILLSTIKIDIATTLNAIRWGMVAMGITTVLQVLWKGYIGSGALAPPIISAIYLQPSMQALSLGGLPALMAMTCFAGLIEILFSFLLRFLRWLFTPAFIGLIVITVGLLLGTEGLKKAFSIGEQNSPLFARHCLNAVITLVAIITMSLWGKGVFRLMGTLIGVLFGSCTAVLLGLVGHHEGDIFRQLPLFSLPSLPSFEFRFIPLLTIPFVICAIASALRVMGTIITSQQVNDAEWKRPYQPSLHKGILADGIGLTFAGLFGVLGLSASPSAVGISKITGATSRNIAFAVAGILFICAVIPKVVSLFLIMPMSVAGAALMINGSFMIMAGIRILTSRFIDTRAIYVVGISMLMGTSRLLFPNFYESLPPALRYFTDSPLSLTTLTALLLTLWFRLGLVRKIIPTAYKRLTSSAAFRPYLLEHIKKWEGVAPATIDHATDVSKSFLSQLEGLGVSLDQLDIEIHYDQTDLKIGFKYHGFLVKLDSPEDNRQYYLEEDPFSSGLSRMLQGNLPDHYTFSTKDGLCHVQFKFYT